MKNLLILLLALLGASCVTSADLQRLTTAQVDFERDVQLAMTSATLDSSQKLEAVKTANQIRLDEAGRVLEGIQERTETLTAAATKGPLGIGSMLIEGALALLVGGAATAKVVNHQRDKQSLGTYNKPVA